MMTLLGLGLINGAGDGNRTRINSLEGCGNSRYTTPALSKRFLCFKNLTYEPLNIKEIFRKYEKLALTSHFK
jgi:hypothetical protein